MKVTYNRLVQGDIFEICEYYDSKGDGLSNAFFAEFESVIEEIKEEPGRWSFIKTGSGKSSPSLNGSLTSLYIVYRIVSPVHIRVFVVKHKKRRDRLGMRRL